MRVLADFEKRMSTQVIPDALTTGPSWDDFAIFPLQDAEKHLERWSTSLPVPASGRPYVSGGSMALGLRRDGNGCTIAKGHEIGELVLPRLNTIIADSLKAAGRGSAGRPCR